jgi:Tfp pilus assembly protein FimT
MFQNYQLQTTARQLVTDLQFAKMRAVAQKVDYQIIFDRTNSSYTIKMGAATVGISRNLADPSNPYYSRGVTLADNFANDKVIFSPVGQASGPGTTTFAASGNTMRVTVTLAGGIYVQ